MFNALFLSYKVAFVLSVNHFIYFLKKLPLLGKKIPQGIYQLSTVKILLAAFVELFKLMIGFLLSILAMGFFVFGPIYLVDKQLINIGLFYYYFFPLYFFIGPIMTNIIFTTQDIQAYTLVHILKVNKRDFFMAKLFFTLGLKLFRHLIILWVVGLFLKFTTMEVLMLSFYVLFMGLIWEGLILLIFNKKEMNIYKKPLSYVGVIIAVLVVFYPLPYFGYIINLRKIILNIPFFLMTLSMATFASVKLYTYEKYNQVARETLSRENVFRIATILENASFADVNVDEKTLMKEKIKINGDLEGYPYFHHLFFARHGSIFKKPVKLRVNVLSVITLLIWGVLLFKANWRVPATDVLKFVSPYLVFFMYFISTGEKFSRAMFFNCDRYMLKEGYYKEKEAILTNFTLRLKKVVLMNLAPGGIIGIMILGIGIIGGMGANLIQLFPLVVTVLALALFFATHYLFLYYILQPYTVQLTKKSPLFSIVNAMVYFIAYGLMQVRTDSLYFTIGVLAFTLTYVVIAIISTYMFAPKTFKLK